MSENVFVIGAPMALKGKGDWTLKVVGSRRHSAARTTGQCGMVATPQGPVVLQPYVPTSFPTQGPWMLTHDICSSPKQFPYSQSAGCTGDDGSCKCGGSCGGGGTCGCKSCDSAPAPSEGFSGYVGEHDYPGIIRRPGSGYAEAPMTSCGCGTTGARVLRPPMSRQPGSTGVRRVTGTPCSQVPVMVNATFPVPQRMVAEPRYQIPAAGCSSCAPCAAAPGPRMLVYNPYGSI